MSLNGYKCRDSKGVAGAEGELAVVFSNEQAWLVLVRGGGVNHLNHENY